MGALRCAAVPSLIVQANEVGGGSAGTYRAPPLAMDAHRETRLDAGQAATQVIETAVRLARAEATLALAHGRTLAVRAVSVWAAVMLAASAVQVALVLIALAPTLFQSPGALLLAISPAVLLSAIGLFLAVRGLRKLRSDPITLVDEADDR